MTAHYVYRCYSSDRLLYVGRTGCLARRVDQHRSAFWAPEVVKVRAVVLPYAEAVAQEAAAIITERPCYNVKGRWATRLSWTVEDCDDYLRALQYTADTGYGQAHRANALAFCDLLSERAA